MKKIISSIILLILCSCATGETEIKSQTAVGDRKMATEGTLAQKSAYKEYHLKQLAVWFQANRNNAQIKDYILNVPEVKGERKLLFTDMIKIIQVEKNIEKEILESFNAFNNLGGSDWTPTLTFLDVAKQNNVFRRDAGTKTDLYFFPGVETEIPQIAFPAFTIDPIIFTPIDLSGWTFTLFDPALTAGQAINYNLLVLDIQLNIGLLGSNMSQPVQNFPSASRILINKMTIKNLKEAYINGCAEVQMIGFTTSITPEFSGDCGGPLFGSGTCNSFNFVGKEIDEIGRDYENHEHQHDYLVHDYSGGIPFGGGVVMNYIIFEHDSWPSLTGKTFSFPNGVTRNAYFGSYQSPYHHIQVMKTANGIFPFSGTYLENNSDIKYNLLGGGE